MSLALFAFMAGLLVNAGGPQSPLPRTDDGSATEDLTPAATEVDGSFRTTSFNLLGWSHTAKGGNSKGFESGEKRTKYALKLLDRKNIDVAGLQEMQPQQYAKFMKLTQGSWGVYPGNSLTRYAMHNSIVWRTSQWELVEANTIPITYFNGELVPMPYILLRSIDSGRLVWFANFHNPANGRGRPNQQKWRNKATALQAQLANTLWETGVPLIMTGDMNERENYFCKLTTLAPMRSASGGSYGASACSPPVGMNIDWIFGSNFVRFSDYNVSRGKLVRKASDHPMIIARVYVPLRKRT